MTLEFDPHHVAVAKENIAAAGVEAQVELSVGAALDSFDALRAEDAAPFDFVFIDADKPHNPRYLDQALALSWPGTVIVCDNVVRDGAVIDAANPDPRIQGVRATHERLAADPRLEATAVQTVGGKGYDGLYIAMVKG